MDNKIVNQPNANKAESNFTNLRARKKVGTSNTPGNVGVFEQIDVNGTQEWVVEQSDANITTNESNTIVISVPNAVDPQTPPSNILIQAGNGTATQDGGNITIQSGAATGEAKAGTITIAGDTIYLGALDPRVTIDASGDLNVPGQLTANSTQLNGLTVSNSVITSSNADGFTISNSAGDLTLGLSAEQVCNIGSTQIDVNGNITAPQITLGEESNSLSITAQELSADNGLQINSGAGNITLTPSENVNVDGKLIMNGNNAIQCNQLQSAEAGTSIIFNSPMVFGTAATAPTSPEVGTAFYNTALNALQVYQGSTPSWVTFGQSNGINNPTFTGLITAQGILSGVGSSSPLCIGQVAAYIPASNPVAPAASFNLGISVTNAILCKAQVYGLGFTNTNTTGMGFYDLGSIILYYNGTGWVSKIVSSVSNTNIINFSVVTPAWCTTCATSGNIGVTLGGLSSSNVKYVVNYQYVLLNTNSSN